MNSGTISLGLLQGDAGMALLDEQKFLEDSTSQSATGISTYCKFSRASVPPTLFLYDLFPALSIFLPDNVFFQFFNYSMC